MASITYPVGALVDDSGAILTAPVVTIASVTDKAGVAISSPGATVNGSASATPISVDYDAETHGEAWITLAVSQSGHTITGLNAAPVFYAAKDSSRLATALPAVAAGANGGLPLGDGSGRVVLQPTGLDAVSIADVTNDTDARSTLPKMLRALFNRHFNKVTATASQMQVFNDSGSATQTLAVSDDGTTATKGKSA